MNEEASSESATKSRLREVSLLSRLLNRPELGSVAGTVLVFAIFLVVAGDSGMFSIDGAFSWIKLASYLGIIAIGACLLMIAGEFDLSVGSMIGFAGMLIAIPAKYWGWPVWSSILFAFTGSMAIGYMIGYTVVKTRLPSFIVSLAFLFILRGLTIGLAITLANRTIIGGIGINGGLAEGDWLASIFGFVIGGPNGLYAVVVWFIILAVIASFVLLRTKFGNWIFASGGDANAARNVGVPVDRVKIMLFMFTAFCATLYATCEMMEYGSASADRGNLKEFEAIIAAVIGGALLTGGYGSVIGACFGALIFAVVQVGINFSGIDNSWYRVVLGLLLLSAVVFNNFIRRRVTGS